MPVINYRTANGRIISQNNSKTGYQRLLNDPLGNVIATADSTGTKSNDTTYWPYGEVRTGRVGVITSFGFCGMWGYYTDSSGRQYVRARYYRPTLGRWQTVDPLWPGERAFEYGNFAPSTHVDPQGSKAWKCSDLRDCLDKAKDHKCEALKGKQRPATELLLCIAWQESSLDRRGNANEGTLNLTEIAFRELRSKKCSWLDKFSMW